MVIVTGSFRLYCLKQVAPLKNTFFSFSMVVKNSILTRRSTMGLSLSLYNYLFVGLDVGARFRCHQDAKNA